MEKLEEDINKPMIRDRMGRFSEGNKEGRKFPKGYDGRPKGVKNRKTIIAREFAYDVLHTDPETGKKMTYKQLVHHIAKKADALPRILNLLLDHHFGKPIERVEHEMQTIHISIAGDESSPENKNIITIIGEDKNTDNAEVVEEEQKSLPEDE